MLPRRLGAQCPDGTPPPCGAAPSPRVQYARMLLEQRPELQRRGDFRLARALTCRALAIAQDVRARLPWDCRTFRIAVALPAGYGDDALARLAQASSSPTYFDDLAFEIRAVLAAFPSFVNSFGDIADATGLSGIFQAELRDLPLDCASRQFSPWFPCDSVTGLASLTFVMRPNELVVAISTRNWRTALALQDSLLSHFALPIRSAGHTRYVRRVTQNPLATPMERQSVRPDSLVCSREVTGAWSAAKLRVVLRAFDLPGLRTVTADQATAEMVTDGAFTRATWCTALWELLATYGLRAVPLSPSALLVSR